MNRLLRRLLTGPWRHHARLVSYLLLTPPGDELSPRGLTVYQPPDRGPLGRDIWDPPSFFQSHVDTSGSVERKAFQRRTPQQHVARYVRLRLADRAAPRSDTDCSVSQFWHFFHLLAVLISRRRGRNACSTMDKKWRIFKPVDPKDAG